MNWFKHFIQPKYWATRSPMAIDVPFKKQIVNKIIANTGMTPIILKPNQWEPDTRHKLHMAMVAPIATQDQSDKCTSDLERENQKKLFNFESEGYKPVISGVNVDPSY